MASRRSSATNYPESARGRLVHIGDDQYYRGAGCDPDCPGFGQCCPPFDLRDRPKSVVDARKVLLERDDSRRWELQEALLILAHDGSDEAVEILEAYMPRAHARLEGFAECTLDEGRFFNTIPVSEEEEEQMMKREVLQHYKDRLIRAQSEIEEDLQPKLARLRYEMEILQRVRDKAQDERKREDWQIQVDVQDMVIVQEEGRLAELQAEIAHCEAVIAEIEADLG